MAEAPSTPPGTPAPEVCAEHPLTVIVEHVSFGCKSEILLAALDEQGFELPFQGADRLANGGLGDLVDLGGFGEALGFAQITEDFQRFQLMEELNRNPVPWSTAVKGGDAVWRDRNHRITTCS
jgi:hypothetical protein